MPSKFFLTLSVLLLITGGAVFAQTESPEKANYSAYITSLENYQKVHDEYNLARSQYLIFETLKSKTVAQNSALEMLEARSTVVIDYLSFLKGKVESLEGVDTAKAVSTVSMLDDEIVWYSDHKSKLTSALTLEDLLADSKQAEDHFEYTQKVYYSSLSLISDGVVGGNTEKLLILSQNLKNKLQTIKSDSNNVLSLEKTQLIDRWVFESDARIERIDGKRKDTEPLASKIMSSKTAGEPEKFYNKITPLLEEAKQYLAEANSFLVEVVKEIKVSD